MDTFTKTFQRAHDIDWFAKSGNIYIHAMSFGGLLPTSVNNKNRNFRIMKRAYISLPEHEDVELIWNERYLLRRLHQVEIGEEEYQIRRARYLIHFNEMAKRGFYSFDKDLNNERNYHLIVRPRNPFLGDWYRGAMPEIAEESLTWEGDADCMMHIDIGE